MAYQFGAKNKLEYAQQNTDKFEYEGAKYIQTFVHIKITPVNIMGVDFDLVLGLSNSKGTIIHYAENYSKKLKQCSFMLDGSRYVDAGILYDVELVPIKKDYDKLYVIKNDLKKVFTNKYKKFEKMNTEGYYEASSKGTRVFSSGDFKRIVYSGRNYLSNKYDDVYASWLKDGAKSQTRNTDRL